MLYRLAAPVAEPIHWRQAPANECRNAGPVFISVIEGTMTFYESDDPDCQPIVRHAGEGFVDGRTDRHSHIARNETAVPARNHECEASGPPRQGQAGAEESAYRSFARPDDGLRLLRPGFENPRTLGGAPALQTAAVKVHPLGKRTGEILALFGVPAEIEELRAPRL